MKRFVCLSVVLMLVGMCAAAEAGTISWGAAQNITNDLDVVNNQGKLIHAYAGNDTTVNDVHFLANWTGIQPADQYGGFKGWQQVNDTCVSPEYYLNRTTNTYGTSAAGTAYAGLTTAYQAVVKGGLDHYNGGSPASMTYTIGDLIAGHEYMVQVWANDSRSFGTTRNSSYDGAVTLKFNTGTTDGGVGQYAIGTFTASGTTQTFTVTSQVVALVNAMQVRDMTPVPEPSTMALAAMGLVGLIAYAWRKRK